MPALECETDIGRDLTTEPSLCAVFQKTAARVPDRPALVVGARADTVTWGQYADGVRLHAAGLASLGVRRGDVVALMLTNRPEFHVVEAATAHLGAATVSVYATYPADDIAYVLRDSGAAVIVTESAF